MGGSDDDASEGITVDGNANIYVVGSSYLYEWGTPVNPHAGWTDDAFAVKIQYSSTVRVKTDLDRLTEFQLSQNYPNPFNPSTKISWQSPIRSYQVLKIFDILGKELVTLVNEEREAGYHSVDFNASDLPSGVYFYQLLVSALQSKNGKTGGFIDTKKMVLLR